MTTENEPDSIQEDDLLSKIKLNIDKFGLQVILIGSTNYCPSFAYSIGLAEKYNHPEIICFGLPNDHGQVIINDIAERIKKGDTLKTDEIYTQIFRNTKAVFVHVDKRNLEDYFGVAINYYGQKSFDALQVVWADRNGKFPWEDHFEEKLLYVQPLLDRNAEFKFYEPKNRTAFTTRQWVEEKKPILRVVHDSDGDWQFLTGDQLPEDIRIVALEELIKQDNSLNQVFDLEYSEFAEREFIGGEWTRGKVPTVDDNSYSQKKNDNK